MTITPLSHEEKACSRFTHRLVLTYLDCIGETSGTAFAIWPKLSEQTSPLAPIGFRVSACALKVVTLFVAPSMTDLSITIGDDGSANRFLTSSEIGGTTTPVAAGFWYETFAAAPFIYTTANTIDAVLTATGAALSALTAGEVHIFLNACELNMLDAGV